MVYKKILLLAASVFVIIIFFSVDFYNDWLESKVLNAFGYSDKATEWDLFDFQIKHLGIEERRAARLGSTYSFCQTMKDFLHDEHEQNPLILLPSQEYMKANGINILIPEPIVLYYESGLKGAWTNSANVSKCNWTVVPDGKGSVVPVKITNKEQLNVIIAEFNKYKQ